jgi:hypothetical protein
MDNKTAFFFFYHLFSLESFLLKPVLIPHLKHDFLIPIIKVYNMTHRKVSMGTVSI